jgi:phage shock protein PspC (stress-responsive transcriptional regulator)
MSDDETAGPADSYTWDEHVRLLAFVLTPLGMIFVGVLETVLALAVLWLLLPNETAA